MALQVPASFRWLYAYQGAFGSGKPQVLAGRVLRLVHRQLWRGNGGSNEAWFSLWANLVSSVNPGLWTGSHVEIPICLLDSRHQFHSQINAERLLQSALRVRPELGPRYHPPMGRARGGVHTHNFVLASCFLTNAFSQGRSSHGGEPPKRGLRALLFKH